MNKKLFDLSTFFRHCLKMDSKDFQAGLSLPVWLNQEGFEKYTHFLRGECFKAKQAIPETYNHARSVIEDQAPLIYQEFVQFIKGRYVVSGSMPTIPNRLSNGSYADYLEYLVSCHPRAQDWFQSPFGVSFNRSDRDKHVFCIGQTGSGKSEALKLLFLDTLHRRNVLGEKRSLVLMEPHGDLSSECARLAALHAIQKEINAKLRKVSSSSHARSEIPEPLHAGFQATTTHDLILIDPGLDSTGKRYPCLNVFDIRNQNLSQARIDTYAQSIVRSFSSMVSADSQSFTANMVSLLIPLVTVLLHRQGSTLYDLARFLVANQNADLISLGKKSANPAHQHFFQHLFDSPLYRPTRQALSIRLQLLLNDSQFASLLAGGPSTIDLTAALDQGKVIIINLSKLGLESQQAAARLFHGVISGIVRGRIFSSKKRTPVDYLLDEFQTMVSSDLGSILVEARKYALHTVLATQTLDHLPRDLAKIALANTSVKLVGKVGYSSRAAMARELFTTPETFNHLSTGQFIMQSGDAPFLRVQFTNRFIKNRRSISDSEWHTVKNDQLARYYRKPISLSSNNTRRRSLPDSTMNQEPSNGSFSGLSQESQGPKYQSSNF